jgi:hypothetical protein
MSAHLLTFLNHSRLAVCMISAMTLPAPARLAGQQPETLERSIRRYRDKDMRADEKMFEYGKGLTDPGIKALVTCIGGLQ